MPWEPHPLVRLPVLLLLAGRLGVSGRGSGAEWSLDGTPCRGGSSISGTPFSAVTKSSLDQVLDECEVSHGPAGGGRAPRGPSIGGSVTRHPTAGGQVADLRLCPPQADVATVWGGLSPPSSQRRTQSRAGWTPVGGKASLPVPGIGGAGPEGHATRLPVTSFHVWGAQWFPALGPSCRPLVAPAQVPDPGGGAEAVLAGGAGAPFLSRAPGLGGAFRSVQMAVTRAAPAASRCHKLADGGSRTGQGCPGTTAPQGPDLLLPRPWCSQRNTLTRCGHQCRGGWLAEPGAVAHLDMKSRSPPRQRGRHEGRASAAQCPQL